jgi:hypothetical protein
MKGIIYSIFGLLLLTSYVIKSQVNILGPSTLVSKMKSYDTDNTGGK